MRLPKSMHTAREWRIHEFVRDFELEDVWALPTPGGPDDFQRLVDTAASLDLARSSSFSVRALSTIRFKLGGLLRLDGPDTGLDARVPSLRDRLPADLREGQRGPRSGSLPFEPLYMTAHEFAAEVANRTVHGVIHLGWVPERVGRYRGELAIYVKRNGLLGTAYMAAIRPFRYLLVYPQVMRDIERAWERTDVANS